MLKVQFHNDTYTFDTGNFKMQYFDSGDLHGNDNFRAQNSDITIYEALQRIDAALLQSVFAAKLDGRPVTLATKLTKDCTLEVLTLEDAEGRKIYHHSLAFLIAQTIYTLDIDAQLATLAVSDSQCVLQFIFSENKVLPIDLLENQLEKTITAPAAIQIITGFQKEPLLETYPSLSQPYPQMLLSPYDAYDFVTIAARQNFVLPLQENTILATNPELIRDYSLTYSLNKNIYTITASHI